MAPSAGRDAGLTAAAGAPQRHRIGARRHANEAGAGAGALKRRGHGAVTRLATIGLLALLRPPEARLAEGRGVRAQSGGVLLFRPRQGRTRYYPPQELLDCEGSNFSSAWGEFRLAVQANEAQGFPEEPSLYRRAADIVMKWSEDVMPGSVMVPQVLVRQALAERLRGFCLWGYATAMYILYRHDRNPERLEAIEQMMGWVEWPLDFMESSTWPTLWRVVPLHLEEFRGRGDVSWSKSVQHWTDDWPLLPKPTVEDVGWELGSWLRNVGTAVPIGSWLSARRSSAAVGLRLARALGRSRRLRLLVLGHHLGSSMEPFSMLRAAVKVGVGLRIEARFFGQRHPKPGLVCKEFGFCDENPGMEQWFLRYESRWLGTYEWMPNLWDEALSDLSGIMASSGFVGETDAAICGGPAWLCVMLRSLWSVPMLLYFAWPIAPLIPAGFKTQLLTHVRALAQASSPPVVFVTANWVLAAQFAFQLRVEVPVQRPHGLYMNQTYSPVRAPGGKHRILISRLGVWSGTSGIALVEMMLEFLQARACAGVRDPFEIVPLGVRLRHADTSVAVTYADFAEYLACIFWPWDVMMLLFNELYTLTMPLLLPSNRWMIQLMSHQLSHSEMNWWHLRESVGGMLPDPSGKPFPLPFKPWIAKHDGLRPAAYWYSLTDFAQFPYLTYFESLPDMYDQVRSLDIPRIRAGMATFNRQTFRDSLLFYRCAASHLLAAG
mmetsp:Transcript_91776/g.264686  ORF Transcript_91776/g.264686 Transcript_91776/m.264686 type:complete len:719 (+) Transcript_91776:58-2214(+)